MKKNYHSRSKQYLSTVRQDQQSINTPHHLLYNPNTNYYQQLLNIPIGQDSSNEFANTFQRALNPSLYYKGKSLLYAYPSSSKRTNNSNGQSIHKIIPILTERLQNLSKHYRSLIDEQKARNAEKTQCILDFVDEMQATHQSKVQNMKKLIEQAEQEKREVGFVDDKMNLIKSNIDELINQSSQLKESNEAIAKKIENKRKQNSIKEAELEALREQMLSARNQLEKYEIKNIKDNRIKKEIIEIFKTASSIQGND